MDVLRTNADAFRLVDKDDEPPLRKLSHGIEGEALPLKAEQPTPPYPHMIKRDGKWFHGYRFDQDVCDKMLHETPEMMSRFGPGDKAADVFFRNTIGYVAAGGELKCFTAAGDELADRLQEILTPAASQVFPGASEVGLTPKVYSIYANALLPGHVINMHLDVPEFDGLDRSTTPNWLLVAAHCSGLFDKYRVKNCTCVFYPRSTTGGSLAISPPQAHFPLDPASLHEADQATFIEPRIQKVRKGETVAFDADSCFHHSEISRAAGDPCTASILPPQLPEKSSFSARRVEGADGEWEWLVRDRHGQLISVHPERDVRFTISCKLRVVPPSVPRGENETGAPAAPDSPQPRSRSAALDVHTMIRTLAKELYRRGRLQSAEDAESMALVDLAPIMVQEFIKPQCPNKEAVKQLWNL
mmetsp:Transcript_5087/g.9857  ORF Transcript_5087/g.9857 Transcript_5087/m.9857 type:complete len:414 (-) Transcript_5087:361-1602(-)